jgi:hypothetical protein
MPFFHRLRAIVLKLAVIFEVSASCSLRVSPAAMQRAIDLAAPPSSFLHIRGYESK